MKTVLIMMSTYNGGDKIIDQLDSILNQKDVEVHVAIRDDGSTNETLEILKKLQCKYQDRVSCEYGSNKGWKQSFLDLLSSAELAYDYYGFSDQDDLWMPDKVNTCIKIAEMDNLSGPKLCHCNAISVDSSLNERSEQEYRTASPPSHKAAVATEFFQGCGMLWNKDAMKILKEYRPMDMNLAHDYWVGLICYLFGQVYFCEEPKFYHIRYQENSSSDGSVLKGRIKRFKTLYSGENAYMNPAKDLLTGYEQYLEAEDIVFLKNIDSYKKNVLAKLKLIFDRDFARPSRLSTLLMKFAILINRY